MHIGNNVVNTQELTSILLTQNFKVTSYGMPIIQNDCLIIIVFCR